MKNLFVALAVVALIVVSCGPSAQEIRDKEIADSIKLQDSLDRIDSINKVIEQAKNDSIAKAIADSIKNDSIAKAGKKGKK